MAGKGSAGLSQKPTQLPARYTRGFAWDLDERCQIARELASDLWQLWTDLSGIESLSVQEQWLCERVVYIRRQLLTFESAVMAGSSPPFDAGVYSNLANVLQGYLKALGFKRRARPVRGLQEYLAGSGKGAA